MPKAVRLSCPIALLSGLAPDELAITALSARHFIVAAVLMEFLVLEEPGPIAVCARGDDHD